MRLFYEAESLPPRQDAGDQQQTGKNHIHPADRPSLLWRGIQSYY